MQVFQRSTKLTLLLAWTWWFVYVPFCSASGKIGLGADLADVDAGRSDDRVLLGAPLSRGRPSRRTRWFGDRPVGIGRCRSTAFAAAHVAHRWRSATRAVGVPWLRRSCRLTTGFFDSARVVFTGILAPQEGDMMILASFVLAAGGQGGPAVPCPPFSPSAGPVVVSAVAPRFPDIAVQARVSTTLEVCVAVGADGVPSTAALDPPFRIMKPAVEAAALQWRFAPAASDTEPQKVRLRFVLRLIPKGSPPADETSVFRPPYEIEIRHIEPELVSHSVR
jgi:hypothetical protein